MADLLMKTMTETIKVFIFLQCISVSLNNEVKQNYKYNKKINGSIKSHYDIHHITKIRARRFGMFGSSSKSKQLYGPFGASSPYLSNAYSQQYQPKSPFGIQNPSNVFGKPQQFSPNLAIKPSNAFVKIPPVGPNDMQSQFNPFPKQESTKSTMPIKNNNPTTPPTINDREQGDIYMHAVEIDPHTTPDTIDTVISGKHENDQLSNLLQDQSNIQEVIPKQSFLNAQLPFLPQENEIKAVNQPKFYIPQNSINLQTFKPTGVHDNVNIPNVIPRPQFPEKQSPFIPQYKPATVHVPITTVSQPKSYMPQTSTQVKSNTPELDPTPHFTGTKSPLLLQEESRVVNTHSQTVTQPQIYIPKNPPVGFPVMSNPLGSFGMGYPAALFGKSNRFGSYGQQKPFNPPGLFKPNHFYITPKTIFKAPKVYGDIFKTSLKPILYPYQPSQDVESKEPPTKDTVHKESSDTVYPEPDPKERLSAQDASDLKSYSHGVKQQPGGLGGEPETNRNSKLNQQLTATPLMLDAIRTADTTPSIRVRRFMVNRGPIVGFNPYMPMIPRPMIPFVPYGSIRNQMMGVPVVPKKVNSTDDQSIRKTSSHTKTTRVPFSLAYIHCENKPCKNGGKCVGDKYFMYCACENDYSGDRCEEHMPKCDDMMCGKYECVEYSFEVFCVCNATMCHMKKEENTEQERFVNREHAGIIAVCVIFGILDIAIMVYCLRVCSKRKNIHDKYRRLLKENLVPEDLPPDFLTLTLCGGGEGIRKIDDQMEAHTASKKKKSKKKKKKKDKDSKKDKDNNSQEANKSTNCPGTKFHQCLGGVEYTCNDDMADDNFSDCLDNYKWVANKNNGNYSLYGYKRNRTRCIPNWFSRNTNTEPRSKHSTSNNYNLNTNTSSKYKYIFDSHSNKTKRLTTHPRKTIFWKLFSKKSSDKRLDWRLQYPRTYYDPLEVMKFMWSDENVKKVRSSEDTNSETDDSYLDSSSEDDSGSESVIYTRQVHTS